MSLAHSLPVGGTVAVPTCSSDIPVVVEAAPTQKIEEVIIALMQRAKRVLPLGAMVSVSQATNTNNVPVAREHWIDGVSVELNSADRDNGSILTKIDGRYYTLHLIGENARTIFNCLIK